MIFADLNQNSYLLKIIHIQPGDTNMFTTDSRTTSPDNNIAEYLTV